MEISLKRGPLSALVTTKGGELISFKKNDTEYIWSGDPAFWSGRNPILFPIVGNLKNGQMSYKGLTYQMNRHGFARNMEWTIFKQADDFVTLELLSNIETLEKYPFSFSLQVTHKLLENGFSTSFQIENRSSEPMPFSIGAHTAFRCPIFPGEAFADYKLSFEKAENAHGKRLTSEGLFAREAGELLLDNSDTIELDYEDFRRLDTMAFENLSSKKVSLLNKNTEKGLALNFEEFPLIAFWTKPGAEFICLEPWTGCADSTESSGVFVDKEHLIFLAPEDTSRFTFDISIID